jgi:hypothetical protein
LNAQFNNLTKSLLIAPTSILAVVALIAFTLVPPEHFRQASGILLMTFATAAFFAFAGVASALNKMKVYPESRTPWSLALTIYGAGPFLLFAAAFVVPGIATST